LRAAIRKKYRLPFRLLADVGGKVRKAFKVPATFGLLPGRVTFVIDKSGVIRHAFNSQMNATQHVDEALGILSSLR
jgi:peroxiredoxin Q/BCP